MSETLTIHTDRGSLQLPAPCSLEAALAHLLEAAGAEPANASRVATAVNGQFVARHQRGAHWLADGDTVLCFSPITGG